MNMLSATELKDNEIDRLRSELNRMRDELQRTKSENKMLKDTIVRLTMKLVGVNE